MYPELPTATKVLFPNPTPKKVALKIEITLLINDPLDLKDDPLSLIKDDPLSLKSVVFDLGNVLIDDAPLSVDLKMVPDSPTHTKVLFPNPTALREFVVGEVTVLKDAPLSVDLKMVPELPTPTKVLFPNPTPQREFEGGEVTILKDAPLSVDLKMVPEPTATKVLFPNPTDMREFVVGEVTVLKDAPIVR